jgi:hypothetical protein
MNEAGAAALRKGVPRISEVYFNSLLDTPASDACHSVMTGLRLAYSVADVDVVHR